MSNLELVSSNSDEFTEKFNNIQDKIKRKTVLEMEPTLDEQKRVRAIILKYIKDNKRKLYGGFALHKLLTNKDPKLALYSEYDTYDIDCYSPEPMVDAVELSKLLFKEGINAVQAGEADHKETYNIFVNYQEYVNFSYVPSIIYNNMRFLEIDGFRVIHPWFMMIDYFRMFSDPLGSYWRLDKSHKRYQILEKYYPLPKTKEFLTSPKNIPNLQQNTYDVLNKCFNYLCNVDTLLFTGFYAYDYYVYINDIDKGSKTGGKSLDNNNNNNNATNGNNNANNNLTNANNNSTNSNINNTNNNNNNVIGGKSFDKSHTKQHETYINIPYYELYSVNYVEDGINLLAFIDSLPNKDDFKYEEHYQFFQFFDFSTVIYYKNTPIIYLYGNNNSCIPFVSVPAIQFSTHNNKVTPLPSNKNINLCSFDKNILHQLILLVKVRVENNNDANDGIYKHINGIVNLRDSYLMSKKIPKMGDGTVFEHLVTDCIGKQGNPKREKLLLMKERFKQHKKTKFRYEPECDKNDFDASGIKFSNSSGNVIMAKHHLKLNNEPLVEDNESVDDESIDDSVKK